ncbi:MAG: 1,4-alpha-glucan branching protein domain-containing protein [Planctomycetota bacterium]
MIGRRGLFALVLHAHLPLVRHPEHEQSIEEEWFFEALAECYLPLWRVLQRLVADGVRPGITISLSGPLRQMLGDRWLLGRFDEWLARRLALVEREAQRTGAPAHLVTYHRDRLQHAADSLAACNRQLAPALGALARAGAIELATGTATHAFAPLWPAPVELWRRQVRDALPPFRAAIGERDDARAPGMWLAECGFVPGMERELAAAGVRWFVVDAHAFAAADSPPPTGVYAPVWCAAGGGGLAAFARDPETAAQVWHADVGFPADAAYLDFHKDIGFELPLADLQPVIGSEQLRRPTGLRYWRITDRAGTHREWYDPAAASARVRGHAREFVRARVEQVDRLLAAGWRGDAPPLVVAPYDAELFGHWWHEGPQFVDALCRELAAAADDPAGIAAITPGEYLTRWASHAVATPGASSWGAGGYTGVWLNEQTDWIVRGVQRVADELVRFNDSSSRALRQAWRELMLAQASDWAFLIRMGTNAGYATARARDHLAAAERLVTMVRDGRSDVAWLKEREARWGEVR